MTLRNAKQFKGRALRARDGEVGHIRDFYFDDLHWHVRYCIVETGPWLKSRKVLISSTVLGAYDATLQVLPVELTIDQVRNSPDIDADKPVSRQHEEELARYYGWPPYWDGVFGVGGLATPILSPMPPTNAGGGLTDGDRPPKPRGDPHLRSANDVTGYAIEATDGNIGHVEDLLIDDHHWRIRYLVVDTRNWWPGRKVVVAPAWIRAVSWETSRVSVELAREEIRGSPRYEPSETWNPAYAAELHDYYGRPRDQDWEHSETPAGGRTRQPREH